MICEHCGSMRTENISLRSGNKYRELVHYPHCKILKNAERILRKEVRKNEYKRFR